MLTFHMAGVCGTKSPVGTFDLNAHILVQLHQSGLIEKNSLDHDTCISTKMQSKARQTNQLHPGQLFFREKMNLPWVGFEPMTLCSRGDTVQNRATRATQLVGVRITAPHNTRQRKTSKHHSAMAQYTPTWNAGAGWGNETINDGQLK